MKRIDRLIISELFGPWFFGVAMFTSLLLAATYLGRIADFVVQGVPVMTIIKVTLLYLPPMLVQTFTMSTLLGALLAFGRLSGDSEIVALRASGASIYRIIRPVALFSLAVAITAFLMNDTFVPNATKQATNLTELVQKDVKKRKSQPVFNTISENGVLKAMIMAQDINIAEGTLKGVTVKALSADGKPTYYLEANELRYTGDEKNWRVIGGARLFSADNQNVTEITGDIWPGEIPRPNKTPQQMTAPVVNNPDYYSTGELREILSRRSFDKSLTAEEYRNREYWLWNKYAVPMAAFVFGVLGAALGIRSHRAGTATGFALAIAIMFAYMTLANFMNVWAMGGVIPSYVASLSPIVLGLGAALFIMWRRNTA